MHTTKTNSFHILRPNRFTITCRLIFNYNCCTTKMCVIPITYITHQFSNTFAIDKINTFRSLTLLILKDPLVRVVISSILKGSNSLLSLVHVMN